MNNNTFISILAKGLVGCTMGAVMTACTFEQDDYFSETASLRVTHMNENIQNRLVEQSSNGNHGWVIQYFVAGTDDYDFEGFTLFGNFYQNNKVTLAGNHRFLRDGHANQYTEATSTYEMLAEEGPVLAFNTWNDILTVLVDPVDPSAAPRSVVQNGEGMFGDQNLVLTSYADDEMVFNGERHRAQVRFVPCDRPWQDYIDAAAKTKADIATTALTSYYVTNGTDTMYFSMLNRGYFNYCDRVNNPLKNKVLSCVFTPQGFRINHVDSLGQNTFQEFTMAADSTKLLSEDGQTQVIACWDNYIINHTAVWNLDTAQFSDQQKQLYQQMDAQFKVYNSSCSIANIGIGKSSGSNAVTGLVVTFYTNAAKTRSNTVGLALDMSKPAFGQINIYSDTDSAVDRNMTSVGTRATNLEALVRDFASTLNGQYSITPNNYFAPTGGKFESINGGTTFVLQ